MVSKAPSRHRSSIWLPPRSRTREELPSGGTSRKQTRGAPPSTAFTCSCVTRAKAGALPGPTLAKSRPCRSQWFAPYPGSRLATVILPFSPRIFTGALDPSVIFRRSLPYNFYRGWRGKEQWEPPSSDVLHLPPDWRSANCLHSSKKFLICHATHPWRLHRSVY